MDCIFNGEVTENIEGSIWIIITVVSQQEKDTYLQTTYVVKYY